MPYRSAILTAIESLRDLETGSPASAIRRHIQDNASIESDDDHSPSKWNENLFQETLKSLVRQGETLHVNGTNYKFTESYLAKRAETLRARADSIQEHLIKINSAAALPILQPHGVYEEEVNSVGSPEKDSPKKKTVHAKVKINDAKIITVMNPEKKKKEGEMDVEDDGRIEEDGKKKHHVKIIPKKVTLKKMISDNEMTNACLG
jgi:hypothetical protein